MIIAVARSIEAGDVEAIQHRLLKWFGIAVPCGWVEDWITSPRCPTADEDQYFWGWFKHRLQESYPAYFSGTRTDDESQIIRITCTMHFFFLYIHESPEMLERLRNESAEKPKEAGRSKISKTNLASIRPVNKEAWNVAPEEMKYGR